MMDKIILFYSAGRTTLIIQDHDFLVKETNKKNIAHMQQVEVGKASANSPTKQQQIHYASVILRNLQMISTNQ